MDADQIHQLMLDAAAQPLRYLTAVFADWEAKNKPGYRVKLPAVQEQIEYAARLFGVTLDEKAAAETRATGYRADRTSDTG